MRPILRLAGFALALLLSLPASAVSIDWVTIGDPGNASDPNTGFGSVADIYRIGRTEVTNDQYVDFLNAVADADPNGLYNTQMDSSGFGGITRSGSSGTFSYSTKIGDENKPVNFVSFLDAFRFANWLHNGQPTGAQGNATTEDGAYTITLQGIADNSITRNAGATHFLPSEDEWYKAAYFNGTSYFLFPAGFDAPTVCAPPTSAPNTANCLRPLPEPTDVGSYTGSASPYGTFDQGGNLYEYIGSLDGGNRPIRGGAFNFEQTTLASTDRSFSGLTSEASFLGFRLAAPIPEPGTGLLVMGGLAGLAVRGRSQVFRGAH